MSLPDDNSKDSFLTDDDVIGIDDVLGNVGNGIVNESYNEKDVLDDVYNDDVARKIRDALDKPRVIGDDIANKLHVPQNLNFYIKLAYLYSQDTLYLSLAQTMEAKRDGKIRTTPAQYFWGIVKRQPKKKHE